MSSSDKVPPTGSWQAGPVAFSRMQTWVLGSPGMVGGAARRGQALMFEVCLESPLLAGSFR